jgi:hypothetical protein
VAADRRKHCDDAHDEREREYGDAEIFMAPPLGCVELARAD